MKTTDNRQQTVIRTDAENRYPLIITRIGTSHMRVQAETEQEALELARKEIELHGLPEEDTREAVDVRSDREAAKPVEAKTDVIETPEGIHLICVTSRYETPVRAAGADLEDAIRHTSVNVGISHPSDEDIDLDSPYLQPVSFDNERFVSFELRPAFRFIDNSLQDWKGASIYFEGAVADELTRKHPDGCTFEVSGLHVDDLKSVLEAGRPLEGSVRGNGTGREPTDGLRAELALTRQEMAGLRPVLEPEDRALQEICRKDPHLDGEGREAAESAYLFRHPDLDGGALRVETSESMLDRLSIEGIPARQAVGIIGSKGITTDSGFKEAAAEMRRLRWLDNRATADDLTEQQREQLKRVSGIALHRVDKDFTSLEMMLECQIDGKLQRPQALYMSDFLLFTNDMVSKEKLAAVYFGEALHPDNVHPLVEGGPEKEVLEDGRTWPVYTDFENEPDEWNVRMLRDLDAHPGISHEMEMPNGEKLEWMIDPFHFSFAVGHRQDNGKLEDKRFFIQEWCGYNISKSLEANIKEMEEHLREMPKYNLVTNERRKTADERKPAMERISDIAVIMMGTKGPHIRCRIDGEQQSAVPISMKDYLAASTRMTAKEELASKYFREALDQPLEQEQKQGVRR